MNYYKYLVRNEVDPTVLKYFLLAYDLKRRNIRVIKRANKIVLVNDIINLSSEKWVMTLKLYQGFLKGIEKNDKSLGLPLWKHEISNANNKTELVNKRLEEFAKLFESIKKEYSSTRQDIIRIIDIRNMPKPKIEFVTTRFSKNYYRLTGMKRCIICDYLGIEKIPVRVLKLKVVQI